MEVKYRRTWTSEFHVFGEHEVGIVHASVDHDLKHGLFDATLFYDEGDDAWSRNDVHLVQTWYSEETVRRLLADAGGFPPGKLV